VEARQNVTLSAGFY